MFPRRFADPGSGALLGPRCGILFVVGQMDGGGLERQLVNLLVAMDRKRRRPALVVWNYQETATHIARVRELGVPVWGYSAKVPSRRKLAALAHLARALKPEVIHSYSFFTNFAAFWAARTAEAVAVGSIRGEGDVAGLIRSRPALGRLSVMFPRFQISNSHAAAAGVIRTRKWIAPQRIAVVPNGLDLEQLRHTAIPDTPPWRILGIGSLQQCKRWDRLLALAGELERRGVPCRVQIAGDGPLRNELEALRIRLGVTGTTRLLGHRTDVADLIRKSRLVVHTSDAEGTPNAVMEALALGRPVVATDVGDVSRLIVEGKTGFVVRPGDSQALADRVVELATNDELAAGFGRAAREHARRNFGLSHLVSGTFDAYREAGWQERAPAIPAGRLRPEHSSGSAVEACTRK